MTEVRLQADQIERIISQVLRDDYKMVPATANAAARAIGLRLIASLPTPGTAALRGTKLMDRFATKEFRDEFEQFVKENGGLSYKEVWEFVYRHTKEVPAVVADAVNY